MLIIIVKGALLAFLVLAVGVIAVVFARRVRHNGFPEPPADPGADAYFRAMFGPRPATPKPDWVNWDEADEEP